MKTPNIKHDLEQALQDLEAVSSTQNFKNLQESLRACLQEFDKKKFFYLFAMCSRWFARGEISSEIRAKHLAQYAGNEEWTAVQCARLWLLLQLSECVERENYCRTVDQLFSTADVNELLLLVRALNYLPESEYFVERAREVARSNIESVFCALAHNSHYAYKYFDQDGWNQLILKAAFLAVPIWSIFGLRERNNAELVKMIKHYIWERQAASRNLPWDIWACLGWAADSKEDEEYLKKPFLALDDLSQAAIVLSLSENNKEEIREFSQFLSENQGLKVSELAWEQLARRNKIS